MMRISIVRLAMFSTSHVALIYGAAGTGKSTLPTIFLTFGQVRISYFLATGILQLII